MRAASFVIDHLWWLLSLLAAPLRRSQRFVLLSPALTRRQLILDRSRGRFLTLATRDAVDWAVLLHAYAREDYSLARLARGSELLEKYNSAVGRGETPLILDIGAHGGFTAAYFAGEFPEARILAVEPAPDNVAWARSTLAGYPNAGVLHAAVSHIAGEGSIADPGFGSWGYRVGEQRGGTVPICTVPDILEDPRFRDSWPFIAKIDIEGGESELFSANTDWVDRFPLIIIELHDWLLPRTANAASFLSCVAGRQRDFVQIREHAFSISNG